MIFPACRWFRVACQYWHGHVRGFTFPSLDDNGYPLLSRCEIDITDWLTSERGKVCDDIKLENHPLQCKLSASSCYHPLSAWLTHSPFRWNYLSVCPLMGGNCEKTMWKTSHHITIGTGGDWYRKATLADCLPCWAVRLNEGLANK